MTTNKKLNTFFNNIGNNAIKNEETSIGIVEELTIQNLAKNLKSNGSTIYTLLGVKNASIAPKSMELWFNELRVSDFDNKSSWAAIVNADANLADFADVSLTGSMHTIGFGSLD